MVVSRQTLYDEVWAEPVAIVAKRYEVSGSFLARICTDLRVPRPARGYWAKLEAGKRLNRPPLPDALAGDFNEWLPGAGLRRSGVPLQVPVPTPIRKSKRSPASRPRAHELTVGVRQHFEDGRLSDTGQLRPRKRQLVDILVTRDQLPRALSFGSELFSALEDRGHRVLFAPSLEESHRPPLYTRKGQPAYEYYRREPWFPNRPTVVFIGTVAIGLTIFEPTEEVEARLLNSEWVRLSEHPLRKGHRDQFTFTHRHEFATGRLAVRASSPYQGTEWEELWTENAAGELGGQTSAIVAALEAAAPKIIPLVGAARAKREAEQREWEKQRRRWAREERVRKRQEALKQSTADLLSLVDAWTRATNIENFFKDIEHRAANLPSDEKDRIDTRLAAARQLLGGTNALDRFARWQGPSDRVSFDEPKTQDDEPESGFP